MARQKSKTSPEVIQRTQRVAMEIQLRLAGLDFTQIAEKVGVSPATVSSDIRKALDAAILNAGMDLRAVQLQRYETLINVLWPMVRNGNMTAMQRVVSVMEAENKLMGVDAPTKIAPTNPEGDKAYEALSPETERQILQDEISRMIQDAESRQ